MRYRWTAAPGRVVFRRVSNRWIFVLILVVGLTILGVGGWATLGSATFSAFVGTFMQMLFAMGALFTVVGLKGLFSADRYDPYEIVFDGTRGVVVLRDAGAGPAMEIPFSDIRGFDVRTKRLPSSQGQSHVSANAHHYFAVVRTASATFEVVQSASRLEPDRAVAAISGCVSASASATEGTSTLPGGLRSKDEGATSTLRWRNAALSPMLFFLFMVSGIGFVMSRFAVIFSEDKSFGGGGLVYPVMGFMILILLFIVVTNMRKMVRDMRSTYELAVGPFGLRYAEYPAAADGAPPRKTVALSPMEIGRVLFEHQIGEQPIPFRALSADLGETERLRFDVVALSATERMMLAAWIRKRSCV